MEISFRGRVEGLTAATGLAVSCTRHALSTSWGPWEDKAEFFGSWLIYFIAMYFVMLIVFVVMQRTEKFFTGEETDPWKNLSVFQYRVMITMLSVTLAILVLAWLPPGTFATSD